MLDKINNIKFIKIIVIQLTKRGDLSFNNCAEKKMIDSITYIKSL